MANRLERLRHFRQLHATCPARSLGGDEEVHFSFAAMAAATAAAQTTLATLPGDALLGIAQCCDSASIAAILCTARRFYVSNARVCARTFCASFVLLRGICIAVDASALCAD